MPLHDVAHALIAPLIFMAIERHSFGACPVTGGLDLDPLHGIDTHLDLMLRGLEVRHEKEAP
jgi:hypothetical protein